MLRGKTPNTASLFQT